MSIIPSRGHRAEGFQVEGNARVQIGDIYYSNNSTSPPSRFHNKRFHVPRNPSPAFTGRKELGKLLRSRCLPSTTPNSQQQQKRFVIYGLGGSGKTQVCLKFAEEHREKFWGIFWIDASSTENLERGYLQVAKVCGLELRVDAVKQWLSNIPESWALILDNADDPGLNISPYFPVGDRGVILITTRNPECWIHATVGSYQLGAMEPDEAVTLILKTTGVGDQSDNSVREIAKQVTKTLGYLALAIIQAGAVIRQGRCKMEEYCTFYDQRRRELLSQKAIQDEEDYKYNVYTTWEVSLRMIEEMSSEAGRDAVELLHFFSFLHYEGISEKIFHQAWKNSRSGSPSEWILTLCQTSQEWNVHSFREALSILQSFSLINYNKNGLISIHPLVHTWTRDRLSPSDQEMIWAKTASTVALSISLSFETLDYHFRKSLVPHIDACLGCQNDGIFHLRYKGDEFQKMATKFAFAYREAGRWQEALQLTEKIVETRKNTLGEEHPDTLYSKHNLAIDYNNAGRRQKALQLSEQVVEARKKILGEEHHESLRSIHYLAIMYSEMGRRQEALQMSEQVVEARKRILGDDHPNTLDSMHNLAVRYSEIGRRQEALQMSEQVVEASKRILGNDHPDTFGSMHNLAIRYSEIGRRQEALQLLEPVLEARKKILGNDHPKTFDSMHNLAINYSEAGRPQEALQLSEQVVEASKRILGNDHPNTLDSMHNLAIRYSEIGRRQEALQLSEQVLEARKKILGNDHPKTFDSMNNLAINYSEAGRRQEALQLSEQVVEARKRILGNDHPHTLASVHNLAICYSKIGRRQEALQMSEQVVEANKRILGNDHPDTLYSIHNLAIDYSNAGRRQEALQLTEQVVEARKRILGNDHPNTLDSMHNLAVRYSEIGRRQEALQLSEQVVEARKKIHGEEHPETLRSIYLLARIYDEIGRWQEALQLLEPVLETSKRVLGDNHPDTLNSMETLASLKECKRKPHSSLARLWKKLT